jgi:hypothetical protein
LLGRERPDDADDAADCDGALVTLEVSEGCAPESDSSAAATAGLLAMALQNQRAYQMKQNQS